MAGADDDPRDDSDAVVEAAEARALMVDGAARLIAGVHAGGRMWVEGAVARIVDAWGVLDEPARSEVSAAASAAGARAAARVEDELRVLFALDPGAQRATPLEVIRSLRREATEVLRAAGVPEVVRDEYEVRAFPDDVYGIVLRTPAELGDDELGGALLAWGLGKAKVLRARAGDDAASKGARGRSACNNRDSAP
jgi:hypothetical protein